MTLEDLTRTVDVPDLAQEIREGRLLLRGDTLTRFCFSFSVETHPIGIYMAKSFGPQAVGLLRRWDQKKTVRDPISGVYVVNEGREFCRIIPGKPMFLVEYTSDFKAVVSKVAFKANHVRVFNVDFPGLPQDWRFEGAELREVEILG